MSYLGIFILISNLSSFFKKQPFSFNKNKKLFVFFCCFPLPSVSIPPLSVGSFYFKFKLFSMLFFFIIFCTFEKFVIVKPWFFSHSLSLIQITKFCQFFSIYYFFL
uniref:Uncharacterized protein n=1 Tax=Panagrolaimus sp. PS1159 TaxID=55785 RepID=A0AC35FTF5_9BILA